MTVTDYPYLPANCRTGRCDHDPDRCMRYRSRRCLSGECTHARQNLLCAVNYPATVPQPLHPQPLFSNTEWETRDPEAEERERDIQRDTNIAARTASPGAADPGRGSSGRVRHSGPNAKFCVLCLSGEHEQVDDGGRA